MALTLFKHREGEREIKNVFTPGWIVAKLHVSKPLVVERHLTENGRFSTSANSLALEEHYSKTVNWNH